MDWKYCSEDWQSVSLHDHSLTECLHNGEELLMFEDGFDVCAENPLNDTGRHKRTGKAAVALKNGRFVSGALSLDTAPYSEDKGFAGECRPVTEDELSELEFEVLDFSIEDGEVVFFGESWKHRNLCDLKFSCETTVFCWNEFTDDAWFQD